MDLPRDVVTDLLPLYLSGEVSDETKRLVDAYLARDADLARAVAAARAFELPGTPAPAPSAAKHALDETRRLIKRRTETLAVAILFTCCRSPSRSTAAASRSC